MRPVRGRVSRSILYNEFSLFLTHDDKATDKSARREAWLRLRGALKDIYAEYGGGEAYLRQEREAFNQDMERREALIAEAMGLSADEAEIAKDES